MYSDWIFNDVFELISEAMSSAAFLPSKTRVTRTGGKHWLGLDSQGYLQNACRVEGTCFSDKEYRSFDLLEIECLLLWGNLNCGVVDLDA